MLRHVKNKMSSRLIINKIDGHFIQSKVIFLKSNDENKTQELGPFGEGIFPEIGTCQEIWNIGYVKPTERNTGKLLINITSEEKELTLNIDKCVYTIENHEAENKNSQEKLGIDKICEKLAERVYENTFVAQKKPWKKSDTSVTIDERYLWDYRIKSIKNLNKKIKINKTVIDLMYSGGYRKLFQAKLFKCNYCKINLRSAKKLRKHMKTHVEFSDCTSPVEYHDNEHQGNETLQSFKLSPNSCTVCRSNVVIIIKQSENYSKLFCNLCRHESLIVEDEKENEGPKLCHVCGEINEGGSCDANH